MAEGIVRTTIVAKDDTKTATASATRNFQTMGQQIDAANKKTSTAMRGLTRQGRAYATQIGYQFQDIAVQIQGGQNALVVFGQQGSQVLSIFGMWGAIAGTFVAIGAAIGSALLPNILGASRAVEKLNDNFSELKDNLTELGTEGMSQAVLAAMVRTETTQLAQHHKELVEIGDKIKQARLELSTARVDVTLRETGTNRLFMKDRDDLAEAQRNLDAYVIEQNRLQLAYEKTRLSLIQLDKALTTVEAGGKILGSKESANGSEEQAMDSALRLRDQYIDSQYAMVQALKASASPMDRHLANIAKYKELIGVAGFTEQDFAQAVINSGKALTKKQKEVEAAKTGLEKYAEAAVDLKATLKDTALDGVKGLEDSLMSVVDGTKSASAAFKDMANSIINDMARMIIQKQITRPLAGALNTFIDETDFGSLFSSGSRAAGGPVLAGKPYMVGEKGPEMFIPSQNGNVRESTGDTINVTYSPQVTAFDARSASQAVAAQAPTVVSIVEQAFNRRGMRGPLTA